MSKITIQTIGLFVALAAIVASAPFLWQIGSVEDEKAGLKIGEAIPAFTGIDGWFNSEGLTNDELQGKVVFVNTWFLSCPYCHEEMPDVVDLFEKYSKAGVVFVGMTQEEGESVPNVQRFLTKYKVEWPNAYGARETMMSFKADYFPGYWLIDRDGKVVWNKSLRGKVSIESAIEEALAASAPSRSAIEPPATSTTLEPEVTPQTNDNAATARI